MFALRNNGAPEETARAWSAQSCKHDEASFRRIWKVAPRTTGFGLATLERFALQANPGMSFKPDVESIIRPTTTTLSDPAFHVVRFESRYMDDHIMSKHVLPAWDNHKSIVIRAPMGAGKTRALMGLLESHRPVRSALIISPRQTFGEEIYHNFKGVFPELQHYMLDRTVPTRQLAAQQQ